MSHPVRVTRATETDIASVQDWYESQKPGLGRRFVEQVRSTVARISDNPFQYQTAIADVRRALVREFPYALWYRVLEDESVVIACLSHRQDSKSVTDRLLGNDVSRG